MTNLQENIMKSINLWLAEIEQSKDRSAVIDITKEFDIILCRHMIAIVLGEDISNEPVELMVETERLSCKFERKKLGFMYALKEIA